MKYYLKYHLKFKTTSILIYFRSHADLVLIKYFLLLSILLSAVLLNIFVETDILHHCKYI